MLLQSQWSKSKFLSSPLSVNREGFTLLRFISLFGRNSVQAHWMPRLGTGHLIALCVQLPISFPMFWMLSREIACVICKPLVWLDLESNPDLPRTKREIYHLATDAVSILGEWLQIPSWWWHRWLRDRRLVLNELRRDSLRVWVIPRTLSIWHASSLLSTWHFGIEYVIWCPLLPGHWLSIAMSPVAAHLSDQKVEKRDERSSLRQNEALNWEFWALNSMQRAQLNGNLPEVENEILEHELCSVQVWRDDTMTCSIMILADGRNI